MKMIWRTHSKSNKWGNSANSWAFQVKLKVAETFGQNLRMLIWTAALNLQGSGWSEWSSREPYTPHWKTANKQLFCHSVCGHAKRVSTGILLWPRATLPKVSQTFFSTKSFPGENICSSNRKLKTTKRLHQEPGKPGISQIPTQHSVWYKILATYYGCTLQTPPPREQNTTEQPVSHRRYQVSCLLFLGSALVRPGVKGCVPRKLHDNGWCTVPCSCPKHC